MLNLPAIRLVKQCILQIQGYVYMGESKKQKFALVLKLRFWYTEGDFD